MSPASSTPVSPSRPAPDDVPWTSADAPLLPRALRRTFTLPASLFRHRALWLAGAQRELRARLSGTVLGKAWPLIQPLALFLVYFTLFARIFGMRFPARPDAPGSDAVVTAAYIFLGVVVWSAFAESLTRATLCFTERGELLKRVAFPAEVLPLQAIVAQEVLMLAALLAYAAVTSVVTFTAPIAPPLGTALWLLPLLFVLQALFTLGLALATATLHALLRDTIHLVGVLTLLWMFATPVFWIPSARVLPGVEPYLGWLQWNPMHAFVSCWRHALLPPLYADAFTSSLAVDLGHAVAWTAAALLLGGFLFSLGERRLPDEV